MAIVVNRETLQDHLKQIERAAEAASQSLRVRLDAGGLSMLYAMKFLPIGSEPLIPNVSLNIVEQINQTFTCLVSFRAAERLFQLHPGLLELTMNIGNANGPDITGFYEDSSGQRHICGEVFAAVDPDNNRKLSKDVNRVAATAAHHRYVFFFSPKYEPGYLRTREGVEIHVVDIGLRSTPYE